MMLLSHFFFPVDDLFRFIIFLRVMDFNLSCAKYIFAGTCLALVDIITNLRHLLYLAHFRAAADFPYQQLVEMSCLKRT